MRQPRYLIWDWNGTLLEDMWLCVEIINEVLIRRDLPAITPARHQDLFRFPVVEYYRSLGFDMEKESFAVLGDEFMSVYEARKCECSLYPDVPGTLEALDRAGIGQSLLSAYHHDYLVHILGHFGLLDRFDRVMGSHDHYAEGKAEQAAVLIRELNRPPEEILLIGDTLHDFEVAQSVGVQCRLVTTGNHSRARLETAGVGVFDSISEAVGDLIGEE